jgi:glycerol transport system substrate-binding protein
MDRLAGEMDDLMARMQAADEANNAYSGCGPRLNEEQDASVWIEAEGAPWPPLDNEKPQGETFAYDELTQRWTAAQ